MNQRIRELNLQAMSIVMNGSDPDSDVEQMYIPSEFTKKFAELIVRECADIAKHHVMNISTYADAEFVEEQIGKHFGVEE